jgi:hypothetical protein
MTFLANAADTVLLWIHGRRLGLSGDGQSTVSNTLVLDGVIIGSTRAGSPALPTSFTGLSGAGSATLAGAVVGDSVYRVLVGTTGADQTANFEATISVAGHIQQVGAGAGAVVQIAYIQPQS